MSRRDEAAEYLASLVHSSRVRDETLDAICALRETGHGTLILRVPRSAGKPIDAALVTGGLQLNLFETREV